MQEQIAKILKLHEETMQRLPEVEKRIGKHPLAYSIAKYLPALERLAKE